MRPNQLFLRGRLALLCLLMATPARAVPFHLWSRTAGDAASQFPRAVAADPVGNIVTLGEFSGSLDFGAGLLTSAGGDDVFLVKHGPDGTPLWGKRFGDDTTPQHGSGVAIDAGGEILITGFFLNTIDFGAGPLTADGSNDAFVARFEPDGDLKWAKRFGNIDGQYGRVVASDRSRNAILGGNFSGSIDFGGGPLNASGADDVYLAKLDSGGNHLWSHHYGNTGSQQVASLKTDYNENVIAAGNFTGSINFGGSNLVSAGNVDVFVAKLTPAGTHLWSKRFGTLGKQGVSGVALDAGGNLHLAGSFVTSIDFGGVPLTSAGGDDIFVAKLDAFGAYVWSKRFGDLSANQIARAISVDATGRVMVAGTFQGSVDFGAGALTSAGLDDVFIVEFDATGALLFAARYGDAQAQIAETGTLDPFGDAILVGNNMGTIDFGGGPLTTTGAEDAFIVKLETSPLVGVAPPPLATTLAAWPNPFPASTTLRATLPLSGHVRVSIFDAAGRRVTTLSDAPHAGGTLTLPWNGTASDGAAVASGVYFARLDSRSATLVRKLVLVR